MAVLKQFSSGLEIPLCYLSNNLIGVFPASYIGILKLADYAILIHEEKKTDVLVDGFDMTKDYECSYHEGQRHVIVSAHKADNLELLYFFDARNKERKARRESYEKEKKKD